MAPALGSLLPDIACKTTNHTHKPPPYFQYCMSNFQLLSHGCMSNWKNQHKYILIEFFFSHYMTYMQKINSLPLNQMESVQMLWSQTQKLLSIFYIHIPLNSHPSLIFKVLLLKYFSHMKVWGQKKSAGNKLRLNSKAGNPLHYTFLSINQMRKTFFQGSLVFFSSIPILPKITVKWEVWLTEIVFLI